MSFAEPQGNTKDFTLARMEYRPSAGSSKLKAWAQTTYLCHQSFGGHLEYVILCLFFIESLTRLGHCLRKSTKMGT